MLTVISLGVLIDISVDILIDTKEGGGRGGCGVDFSLKPTTPHRRVGEKQNEKFGRPGGSDKLRSVRPGRSIRW